MEENEKARSRTMPTSEALAQTRLYRMARTRPLGRALLGYRQDREKLSKNDGGKCARFSEVASFSSSLKRMLSVVGYAGRWGSPWVLAARHAPRVGGKNSKRFRQTQKQTAAGRKFGGTVPKRGAGLSRPPFQLRHDLKTGRLSRKILPRLPSSLGILLCPSFGKGENENMPVFTPPGVVCW